MYQNLFSLEAHIQGLLNTKKLGKIEFLVSTSGKIVWSSTFWQNIGLKTWVNKILILYYKVVLMILVICDDLKTINLFFTENLLKLKIQKRSDSIFSIVTTLFFSKLLVSHTKNICHASPVAVHIKIV